MNRAVERFRNKMRTGTSMSSGEAPKKLQVVGSRGEINAIEGGAITASNQKQVGRSRQYLGTQDQSEIYLAFNGYFVDSATAGNGYTCAEVNASNDYIIRASIEINGVIKRVKFGGQNQGTVVSGSPLYISDRLVPADFGLTVFPAQTEMWIKCEREFAVGQKAMFHQTATNNPAITGERFMVAPVTSPTQLDTPGELSTANSWVAQSHLWFPFCVLGVPVKPMVSVCTFGASIENGVNDGQGDGLNGAGGYFRRSLADVNGKKVARIHLAKSGETVKSWLNNSTKRRVMLDYVNHVMSGHGGNDYSTGESLANTQARWLQAWELMKAKGAWVEHYALSPKSDSTDAYATVMNQTPRNGYATGGAWRDAGNQWCAAQVGVNPNLNAFVDLGEYQTDVVYKDRWRTDLGKPTDDGTHPNAPIASIMAEYNVSHLQSLITAYEKTVAPVVPQPPAYEIIQSVLSPAGQDYAYWNFMDTSRTFFELLNTNPALNIGDQVGLGLDKAFMAGKTLTDIIAEAPEMGNSGFTLTTNGGTGSASETTPGVLVLIGDGTKAAEARKSYATVPGKIYSVVAQSQQTVAQISVSASETGSELITAQNIGAGQTRRYYFKATSTVTWLRFLRFSNTNVTVRNISFKEVGYHFGYMTTLGARPALNGSGLTFDGIDDNLLTDWLPQDGANSIIAQITVGNDLNSTKIIAGSNQSNDAYAFRISISAAGRLRVNTSLMGADMTDGPTDLRGKTVVVGVSFANNDIRMFAGDRLEGRTSSGFPKANGIPYRIGSRNQQGVSDLPFVGSIKRIAFGKVPFTFAQFRAIRKSWEAN